MQIKLISERKLPYFMMVVASVFSFLISFFIVNPSLHWHFQQIVWQSDRVFFMNHLSYAGGIGEYFALLIGQFLKWNWLGSFIVALLGFCVSLFIYKTITLSAGRVKLLIVSIPFVQLMVLALMFDYKFPIAIAVNLVLISVLLYVSNLFEKNSKFAVPIYTILVGVLVYYICGGMFFVIFMGSSFFILLGKPNLKMVLKMVIILLSTLLLPWLAYKFVFLTSLKSSYFHSTPDVAVMIRYGRSTIYFIGLVMLPAFFLISKLNTFNFWLPKKGNSLVDEVEVSMYKNRRSIIGFTIQLIVLGLVTFFLFKQVYQPQEKLKVEIDCAASEGNWDKVITLNNKLENYDRMANFQYIRAIAHKGQLLDKLFQNEQILGAKGLFLDRPFNAEGALPNSDLYFDLGNIDESLRYAFESQTLMPNSPRVLKRLILNCIVLEKWNAANTYLNVLADNPMERDWVEKYKPLINQEKLSNNDVLIAAKRRDMNKTEGIYVTPRTKLISLLQQNHLNKFAFEYLIAFDLMEHDLAAFLDDFNYYEQLKYDKMPRIIEEAFVLFRSQKRDSEFLNQMRISADTKDRFRKFAALTTASKGDRKKAMETTLEYKDTYWYYVLFLSPLVTNIQIETKPVEANY